MWRRQALEWLSAGSGGFFWPIFDLGMTYKRTRGSCPTNR